MRCDRDEVWRATRTPHGPACLHLRVTAGMLDVRAWGPGGQWALESVPDLVGVADDDSGFVVHHPIVGDLRGRFAGVRLGRTGAVIEALVPAILEQKITGVEARRAWRRLVLRFGEPAPGPCGLFLPPAPDLLARQPYYAFHLVGIERRRAELIQGACGRAAWLEQAAELPREVAYRRLSSIRGIGPWTAAEVGLRAFGDADAVPVGDYHVPNLVSWALAREPRGSDRRMLELLEPYEGNRGRVIRLLEVSGITAPRYGPRAPARDISRL